MDELLIFKANVLSAYVFLAPAIVAGVVTLGVMQQIIRAFGRVEGSMQYLLKAWPTIIELASVYKRLREFEYKIKQEDFVDEKNLMTIDKKFVEQLAIVTSKAALASSYLVGKKDKIGADKAAVDSMRSDLNNLNIQGQIVIGEGELDEAPMLYIGEKLGTHKGPEFDIAVDPLEGTNFVANNLPGALSVIAIAEKNNLFKAPETYMEKISANVSEKNVIDLDYTIKKNIYNLSDYLNKNPENLTACILDRPRHKIIDELKKLKVNLKLITDGDVSGALLVTEEKYNVDIFLGIGGGPEGVLAAAALGI